MKIADLRLTGLAGGTVEGGWAEELTPADNLHTIVEILTDEGLTGIGSAMTSKALVEAGVALLRPLLIGERADEPARVTEKLRQHTFWQGRGGAVEHAISGIDIALWDLMGKVCNQPVCRLLGGTYRDRIKPYGSLLFDEPDQLAAKLQQAIARGFKAIKLGWKPFGRRDSQTDEKLVRIARETVGPSVELMVDAGGSDAFWPHGFKWALRTAQMLANYDIVWFEEALPPDDLAGFHRIAAAVSRPDRDRRGLDAPPEFLAVHSKSRGGHYTARLHQVRRPDRSVADRLDGLRTQRFNSCRMAGTRPSAWRPIFT